MANRGAAKRRHALQIRHDLVLYHPVGWRPHRHPGVHQQHSQVPVRDRDDQHDRSCRPLQKEISRRGRYGSRSVVSGKSQQRYDARWPRPARRSVALRSPRGLDRSPVFNVEVLVQVKEEDAARGGRGSFGGAAGKQRGENMKL